MRHPLVSSTWLPAMAVALVCVVFLAPDPASACSCGVPAGVSPQEIVRQELSRSDAVFTGEVIYIDRPRLVPSSVDPMEVTLRVFETWKGAARETLALRTAVSDASCGYPFDRGGRYLVFASEGTTHGEKEEKELEVGLCGSTEPLSEAGPALGALGPDVASTGAPPTGERLPDTSGGPPARTYLFASGVLALVAVALVCLAGGRWTRP